MKIDKSILNDFTKWFNDNYQEAAIKISALTQVAGGNPLSVEDVEGVLLEASSMIIESSLETGHEFMVISDCILVQITQVPNLDKPVFSIHFDWSINNGDDADNKKHRPTKKDH